MDNTQKRIVWPIIGAGVFLLIMIYFGPLKPYIVPPIKKFIIVHLKFLVDLMFYIFLICCCIFVLLLYLLDRERRSADTTLPQHKSEHVATDYYKGIKRVDYYRAIKHYLSKYHRDSDEEAPPVEDQREKRRGFRPLLTKKKPDEDIDEDDGAVEMSGHPALDAEDVPIRPQDDGPYKTYYKNGQVEQEAYFENGHLQGRFRRYYKDGQLNQEKFYRDGELDGTFRAFDEDGIPYFEINFKNGVKHGIEQVYYPTGTVQYRDTYRNGQKINRKTYDESGNLKFDHNYIDKEEDLDEKYKEKTAD